MRRGDLDTSIMAFARWKRNLRSAQMSRPTMPQISAKEARPPCALESRLVQVWPPPAWQDVTVLVAVSGGADSVAGVRAIQSLKGDGAGRLVAAHFNHHLRGEESEADEQFVTQLCRQIGLDCRVGHHVPDKGIRHRERGENGCENSITSSGRSEAAARRVRYAFLQETAERLGARYVVTAHTADDQAETILHRIIRGTGIAGLAGMARVRSLGPAATLVRPLLDFHRRELLAYLADLGQPFRSDSSNSDLAFTRNRIRHRLLPELAAEYNPEVVESLLRLGRLAGEVQSVVDALVKDLAVRSTSCRSAGSVSICLATLAGQPRYVVRELLIAVWRQQGWPMQSMGFEQWDLLAEMALPCPAPPAAEHGKRMFPGNVLAESHSDLLRLERIACIPGE